MLVALTHGYIRDHPLGGEVSLHRTLVAAKQPATVLTRTPAPYTVDGIQVERIATDDVLNIHADPEPIIQQLRDLGASAVIAQNELSLPAVKAARALNIPSIVSVHTPPKYGRNIQQAVKEATHRIFNTEQSKREWRRPGLVLHPPVSPLPVEPLQGDAITLLSNLRNKGVAVVLEIAEAMPEQRFIIVRSPAETTHGLEGFDEHAASLPNVEVKPRVTPDQVHTYFAETRILVVPSIMETYGMSAIEAAGYSIPSVTIMNAHVAEGIGDGAYGVPPRNRSATELGIHRVNAEYTEWRKRARARAEQIAARQVTELAAFAEWLKAL